MDSSSKTRKGATGKRRGVAEAKGAGVRVRHARTHDRIRRLSAVVRVSKRNGRKGPRFLSPSEQRKAIKAWAAANGVIIVNWYDESDSVSGRTTARPGLQAALAEIEAGRTGGPSGGKVNRFCRKPFEGGLPVGPVQH